MPTLARTTGWCVTLGAVACLIAGFCAGVSAEERKTEGEHRPPVVAFMPESVRNPDPDAFDGMGDPRDYELDMPLSSEGIILAIYRAKSEHGIRAANIAYRVTAKGARPADYPEEYRKVKHPGDDPNGLVFSRLPLKPFTGDPVKLRLGKFVPDLGLFEKSYRGLDGPKRADRSSANVELYVYGNGKEAGGRMNLEVAALRKKVPDGKKGLRTAKLEIGDTVEVYVEVLDNAAGPDGKPDPKRPAGYTPAKRKTVMANEEVARLIREWGEARQKKP